MVSLAARDLKKEPWPQSWKMMKTRVMLARSTDKGQSWKLVSHVSVDPTVGTEGLEYGSAGGKLR